MKTYTLKNGKEITIRTPQIDDAQAIIDHIKQCDTESPFLAREEGEFKATLDKEKEIISNMLNDNDSTWFIAEYEGKLVGQCSISLVHKYLRFRHRNNFQTPIDS